jgi:hypothetical protein
MATPADAKVVNSGGTTEGAENIGHDPVSPVRHQPPTVGASG